MRINMDHIPDGVSGDWEVKSFEIHDSGASLYNMRLMMNGQGSRRVEAGHYKKLTRGRDTIMSNTRAEISDHTEFIYACYEQGGRVLINGLGLGVALTALLHPPEKHWGHTPKELTEIVVIEQSEDVIKLVAPYYDDPRVTIIHADAMEYRPPKGERFSVVWHDIWDNICTDNLPEMHTLHRRYGQRTSWQGSWARGTCERDRREEQKYAMPAWLS